MRNGLFRVVAFVFLSFAFVAVIDLTAQSMGLIVARPIFKICRLSAVTAVQSVFP